MIKEINLEYSIKKKLGSVLKHLFELNLFNVEIQRANIEEDLRAVREAAQLLNRLKQQLPKGKVQTQKYLEAKLKGE